LIVASAITKQLAQSNSNHKARFRTSSNEDSGSHLFITEATLVQHSNRCSHKRQRLKSFSNNTHEKTNKKNDKRPRGSTDLQTNFLKNSLATTEAEHQVQGGLLVDVVVSEGAAILELLTSKDQALLVWWDCQTCSSNSNSPKIQIQGTHRGILCCVKLAAFLVVYLCYLY
jgi:hypothetical protein